jgi:hypothetical protein
MKYYGGEHKEVAMVDYTKAVLTVIAVALVTLADEETA